MPKMFIISGCNGAGKTTASYTMLPEMLECTEYVNADEIAKRLDPVDPGRMALRASMLMVSRINELISRKDDFAMETTLATRTLSTIIKEAKAQGYQISLFYLWLSVPDLAVERVRLRVISGGHDVAEQTILRRYFQGISNLLNIYIPLADYWILIDNSKTRFEFIAEGGSQMETRIHNKTLYNLLINYERNGDQQTKGQSGL